MKNISDTGAGQSITWMLNAEWQRAQRLIAGEDAMRRYETGKQSYADSVPNCISLFEAGNVTGAIIATN